MQNDRKVRLLTLTSPVALSPPDNKVVEAKVLEAQTINVWDAGAQQQLKVFRYLGPTEHMVDLSQPILIRVKTNAIRAAQEVGYVGEKGRVEYAGA